MSMILKQYKDMAFSNNKNELARHEAVRILRDTLNAYIDGMEKSYAVEKDLREVEEIFGDAAALPVRIIRGAMNLEQERQPPHITRAIDMLDKIIRNERPSDLRDF